MNNLAVVGGKYRHFKGNVYELVAVAQHTEREDQQLVIYKDLKNESKVWARPSEMFFDHVVKDGYNGPRFKFLNS